MNDKMLETAFDSVWIAKGLLQDYCEVVAKIENVSPSIIRDRVIQKSEIIKKDWVSRLPQPSPEE